MEVHPLLADQASQEVRNTKSYDIHPSLQVEVHPEEQPEQQVAEEVSDTVEEVVQSVEDTPQEPVQEEPRDRDWRALRARADEAKHLAREKEALERERDFYRQQAMKPGATNNTEDDYLSDTERSLKREMEDLRSQMQKQARETEEAKRQVYVSKSEAALIRDYPDINKVVTEENVAIFKSQYPSLYNAAVSSSDVYDVGAATYEFLIAKGIYKKPKSPISQIVNSANRNAGKPRSISSVSPQSGDTPIKQASNYMGSSISSEDERKQLWAEMSFAARNKNY